MGKGGRPSNQLIRALRVDSQPERKINRFIKLCISRPFHGFHRLTQPIDARLDILYRAEIWQGNRRLNEYPIIQKTNTVGRDDAAKAANLRLPSENRKISRFHAEITQEENGELWVKALHKNPTVVSGQVIRSGERAKLGADGEIMIYDFTIKIKN